MNHTSWPVYAGVMLLTGIGIPIMAATNATLGARIGSAQAASVVVFALGLMVTLIATVITGWPRTSQWTAAPWPFYLGGLAMAFYILSITYIAPRFGVGNAVFFVLLGQILIATSIDQFGLFGAPKADISPARLAGVVLMLVGVFLARKPLIGG